MRFLAFAASFHFFLYLHLHNDLCHCLCLSALSTCCQLMKTHCRLSRFSPASLASAAPGVRPSALLPPPSLPRPPLCLPPSRLFRNFPLLSSVGLLSALDNPPPLHRFTHASLLGSLLLISKLKTSHCLTLPSLSHAFAEASQSETTSMTVLLE